MLAPSVERTQGAAQAFSDASRDAWPRLADLVKRLGGGEFEIRRNGILRVARSAEVAERLRASLREGDRWMDTAAARRRVPALGALAGAALHTGDGVVDAPAALAAMRLAFESAGRVTVERDRLVAMDARKSGLVARLADGGEVDTDVLVLACGAWTPSIEGLPRAIPIRPLRGVMVAVEAPLIDLPVYDAEGHAYLLPRGSTTVIGATSDDAGFDATPAAHDRERLLEAAADVVPAVWDHPVSDAWGGLRPMTPDGLAILGQDPKVPGLFYACGHGRNGFLQAALTAEVIAAKVCGEKVNFDLAPFDPTRF